MVIWAVPVADVLTGGTSEPPVRGVDTADWACKVPDNRRHRMVGIALVDRLPGVRADVFMMVSLKNERNAVSGTVASRKAGFP